MAAAVAQAFETGEHLAVQAGTGTGKSLAYLVPAIVRAVSDDAPGRGVDGDDRPAAPTRRSRSAPAGRFARRCAPAPPAVRAAQGATKLSVPEQDSQRWRRGRSEDAGERPQDELFDPMAATALGRDVQRLTAWASTTESGDRDDLKPGVPTGPGHRSAFPRGNASAWPAARSAPSASPNGARGRAGGADIVVTNHALLAIDAVAESAVLPEHHAAGGRRGARVGRPGDVGGHRGADAGRARGRVAADHPTGESGTDPAAGGGDRPTSPRRSTTPRRAASTTSTRSWRPT